MSRQHTARRDAAVARPMRVLLVVAAVLVFLAGFQLTEPTVWRGLNRRADEAVACHGRLIGGCLDTLMHLVGTPYAPLPAWRAGCAEGVLLYLENSDLPPTDVVRALAQLRMAGWFDGLAGLLLGRSSGQDAGSADALCYQDALHRTLADLPCPVLIDLDIGHRPPQMTLVNGARAELRWGAGDQGRVVQWLD